MWLLPDSSVARRLPGRLPPAMDTTYSNLYRRTCVAAAGLVGGAAAAGAAAACHGHHLQQPTQSAPVRLLPDSSVTRRLPGSAAAGDGLQVSRRLGVLGRLLGPSSSPSCAPSATLGTCSRVHGYVCKGMYANIGYICKHRRYMQFCAGYMCRFAQCVLH